MTSAFEPTTVNEFADVVRSAPRMIVVGAGTKPRLAPVDSELRRVSTRRLSGIIEYEPSEFTFTALAGTPVRDLVAALAERGQYLPFDPLFAQAGSTLGGTVAAGLSGPGRFRFGGLRDFILGVRFVDGSGQLLRMGGKVVKNAAGFDLPKFLVGSLGRFGALAEVTCKVFPRALAALTVRIEAKDVAAKVKIMAEAGSARWEIDALDTMVGEDAVMLRLAGPLAALESLSNDILGRWPGMRLAESDGDAWWTQRGEFRWAHADGTLVKVVLTPAHVPAFDAHVRALPGARGCISAGGNVGYISIAADALGDPLVWPALTLRGAGRLWPGARPRFEVMHAIKQALDPQNRFPGLDEE